MSVYLIQHITNNKTIIDLAITFYTKLKKTYNKKCINCWVDYKKNSVFYLIKAVDKEFIKQLYRNTSQIAPYKISLVNSHLVYELLKSKQQVKNLQLKSVNNTKKHLIALVTQTLNEKLYRNKFNQADFFEAFLYKKTIIQNLIHSYDGIQVNIKEEGFVALFTSSKKALDCSISIQNKLNKKGSKISSKLLLYSYFDSDKDKMTSDKISNLVNSLHFLNPKKQLIFSSSIQNLYNNNYTNINLTNNIKWLYPEEEAFLFSLIDVLSKNYHNSKFNIPSICKLMMMCKTKLYRNCKITTGKSINQILKEFRLLKSLNSLAQNTTNINQTSIDMGFSSSSYFSNCFKKQFGISPNQLLKQQLNFIY
ncbi:helix-turn-helix domain-containing protein [Tenacibaculum caenipelagi]|uniref:AraC-like DNA-binding protein n=1 Tax=Tenacibaculum caenipelagi TaxID=1325435 RepID=A0A4R6THS3_9FLAO|nr:AraC family transcriptional regulator [Tenacibaculum caenipelagi]TDQ30153.1 AraC-like DNA-binding protein [Tenacibaculum caenipelagi]